MIKTIIFDIGKVLLDYDWDAYIRTYGFSPEVNEIVGQAMFYHSAWHELDRGILNADQCEELFIANAPEYAEEIHKVFRGVGAAILREEFAIPWIKSLKERGYRTYFLSNYSEFVEHESQHAMDFMPYLDGGLFSYEVKLIKPGIEIYQKLFERYPDIVPEESVFLDDSAKNVEAAKSLGIHGILVKNHDQAAVDLEALLNQ